MRQSQPHPQPQSATTTLARLSLCGKQSCVSHFCWQSNSNVKGRKLQSFNYLWPRHFLHFSFPHFEKQQVSVCQLGLYGKFIIVLQDLYSISALSPHPPSYISVEIKRLPPVLDNSVLLFLFPFCWKQPHYLQNICLAIHCDVRVLAVIAVGLHLDDFIWFFFV